MTNPPTPREASEPMFFTESFAVLREAERAGPKVASWSRISPDEAKAIRADLRRANELAERWNGPRDQASRRPGGS